MKWEDKLSLLHCIASDLQAIHSQNFIHRDLHSGNILQETLQSARIADLGLLVSTSKSSKIGPNGVCGILPCISPEVLNQQPYTTASDIYSFGIIMWEILFGLPIPKIYNVFRKYFGPELEMQIILTEYDKKMLLQMSNTFNALDAIYDNLDNSDFAELLYDNKIRDIMSNLIDNNPGEIYNDQLINYTTSKSKKQ
ncbi:kinase-like domain-containing protein [Gigaspora rosea]|uniref:Kinase-like domain-containing protein n=1 Tax=Gigaspora rosea TaxID=44941 RepID=A0A397UXZ2_9GLOM|nr:kinase-like domain-containing protein [Gigaspora rosea]